MFRGREIKYEGECNSISGWCTKFGLSRSMVYYRINTLGWSLYRTFNTPKRYTSGNLIYEAKLIYRENLILTEVCRSKLRIQYLITQWKYLLEMEDCFIQVHPVPADEGLKRIRGAIKKAMA